MLRFISLFALIACAPSQEEFEEESWGITCDLLFECTSADEIEAMGQFWFFGETAEDCYALLDAASSDTGTSEEAECDYDKNAAKECLAELEKLTCDEFEDTTSETPEACNNVCGE